MSTPVQSPSSPCAKTELATENAGKLERRESSRLHSATKYLSRLRKNIESRRQTDEKVAAQKVFSPKSLRKPANNETSQNSYFQVEISNRHSGGSDKYSVIEEKDGGDTIAVLENEENNSTEEAKDEASYNIIDVTGLVPRSVNCSPLSLHTFLSGPDLIRDLPAAAPGKKVGRSQSFLSHKEYQRLNLGKDKRPEQYRVKKTSEKMSPQTGQADRQQVVRQTRQGVTVKRSMSAVTERYRPQPRHMKPSRPQPPDSLNHVSVRPTTNLLQRRSSVPYLTAGTFPLQAPTRPQDDFSPKQGTHPLHARTGSTSSNTSSGSLGSSAFIPTSQPKLEGYSDVNQNREKEYPAISQKSVHYNQNNSQSRVQDYIKVSQNEMQQYADRIKNKVEHSSQGNINVQDYTHNISQNIMQDYQSISQNRVEYPDISQNIMEHYPGISQNRVGYREINPNKENQYSDKCLTIEQEKRRSIQSSPSSLSSLPNYPFLPSYHSAFSRPRPSQNKITELEQYAKQWQGNHRRKTRSNSRENSSINIATGPAPQEFRPAFPKQELTVLPSYYDTTPQKTNYYSAEESMSLSTRSMTLPRPPRSRIKKPSLHIVEANEKKNNGGNVSDQRQILADPNSIKPASTSLNYSHSLPRNGKKTGWTKFPKDGVQVSFNPRSNMGQTKNVQDYNKDKNGVRSLVKLFENQALNEANQLNGTSLDNCSKPKCVNEGALTKKENTLLCCQSTHVSAMPDSKYEPSGVSDFSELNFGDNDKQSLVTPPDQFIDNEINITYKTTDTIDNELDNWFLEEHHEFTKKNEYKENNFNFKPKTPDNQRSSFRRSADISLTSPTSADSSSSSASGICSWSNGMTASTVSSSLYSRKDENHIKIRNAFKSKNDKNTFPEESDCEFLFAELSFYFPETSSLEHLFGVNKETKSREDFMGDILNITGHNHDENPEDKYSKAGNLFDRNSNISTFERMTKQLHQSLVTKLDVMQEEEICLELECQENEKEWHRLDERFKESATGYQLDKFELHILEIEKIVFLILSLTGRLVKLVNALDNMEWNGVDERDDLERKRDKLADQLGEAKLLWKSIDKRTEMVAGYVEHCLTRQEGIKFRRMLQKKVRMMLEMKEVKEKIELGKKQLKGIELFSEKGVDFYDEIIV